MSDAVILEGDRSLGIDFGLVQTVAVVMENGSSRALPLVSGYGTSPGAPSCLVFSDSGPVFAGTVYEKERENPPFRCVVPLQSLLIPERVTEVGGTLYAAEELFLEMLRQVRTRVEDLIGALPASIGLAHPVQWGEEIETLARTVFSREHSTLFFLPAPIAVSVGVARIFPVPQDALLFISSPCGAAGTSLVRRVASEFEIVATAGRRKNGDIDRSLSSFGRGAVEEAGATASLFAEVLTVAGAHPSDVTGIVPVGKSSVLLAEAEAIAQVFRLPLLCSPEAECLPALGAASFAAAACVAASSPMASVLSTRASISDVAREERRETPEAAVLDVVARKTPEENVQSSSSPGSLGQSVSGPTPSPLLSAMSGAARIAGGEEASAPWSTEEVSWAEEVQFSDHLDHQEMTLSSTLSLTFVEEKESGQESDQFSSCGVQSEIQSSSERWAEKESSLSITRRKEKREDHRVRHRWRSLRFPGKETASVIHRHLPVELTPAFDLYCRQQIFLFIVGLAALIVGFSSDFFVIVLSVLW